MEKQFLQRTISYIEEKGLIMAKDVVYAGVSGGADSMCLLAVLLAYRRQKDFTLRVIHVEHGLRGMESEMDAAYVEQFCRKRDIHCEIVRVDAAAYAKKRHICVEEAARELRYAAFEERAASLIEEAQAVHGTTGGQDKRRQARIAVAHHREDQAETVLWQMIRGSDMRGLGGMRPQRGRIIRPLLAAYRSEIEGYLNAEGIAWREDKTNASADYTRNIIRGEVLPVLTGLNAQAVAHLFETAERLRETEDFLEEQTALVYEQYVHGEPDGGLFIEEGLAEITPLLMRRVVYAALCRCLGSAKDIGDMHVRLVKELFFRQVGRILHLPYGGRAKRVYGGVKVFTDAGAEDVRTWRPSPEDVQMEVLTQFDLTEISKKKYTKWFNYDKINDNVQIRRRRSGDYLVIDGEGHRQKLARYLINEKIPERERDKLLLVADGSHVMWVIGHRISDYYKVDKDTEKVLKVQLSGGEEDE